MSAKRDLARENEIRRQTTKRKNEDKVIIGYIKAKHPAVYDEAQKYLEGLVAEWPDKKDPSKIKRFRQMMETQTRSETHLAKSKVVKMDSFQLQIELNDYGKRSNPPAQVTVQKTQAEVTTSSSQAEVTAAAGVPTAPDPQDVTLPLMDEETLGQIMAELREDPNIATFFSDFENQLDNCPLW